MTQRAQRRRRNEMLRRILIITLAASVIASVCAPAVSGQTIDRKSPRMDNAKLEERALARSLTAEVKEWAAQAVQAQWLGYAVPQVAGRHQICCGNYNGDWNDGCGNCRLEDRDHGNNVTMSSGEGTARLEGPRNIAVLFRAEN